MTPCPIYCLSVSPSPLFHTRSNPLTPSPPSLAQVLQEELCSCPTDPPNPGCLLHPSSLNPSLTTMNHQTGPPTPDRHLEMMDTQEGNEDTALREGSEDTAIREGSEDTVLLRRCSEDAVLREVSGDTVLREGSGDTVLREGSGNAVLREFPYSPC